MSTTKEQQQQQQQSVNTTLDKTTENARRTIDEARKDIPSYTQMIVEYQEQTFQQRRF
jgi:F0F1-type ATP synthase membrane subunit b/b'